MRKSIVILFALWSFLCHAQNEPYCLHDNSGVYSLATINIATGVVNDISAIPGLSFYVLGSKQFINAHDSTYTFTGHDGTNVRLYTVEMATGTVLSNPIFTNVVGLRYNCMDSTIYGIFEVGGGYALVTVDRVSGLTNQIGFVAAVNAYVGDAFALDVQRGLYHFLGLQGSLIKLFTFDINTGVMLSNPLFPDNVTGWEYNCRDSTIYGLWEDGITYKMETIDPSTGVHTTVGILSNIDPGFVAESASINSNGEYTYRGFSNTNLVLLTIDAATATVINNVAFTPTVSGIDYPTCCDNNIVTSVREVKSSTLTIYPNPFEDKVTLEWGTGIHNGIIEIFDLLGKLVYFENKVSGTNHTILGDHLNSGIYFVKVRGENNISWTGKLFTD